MFLNGIRSSFSKNSSKDSGIEDIQKSRDSQSDDLIEKEDEKKIKTTNDLDEKKIKISTTNKKISPTNPTSTIQNKNNKSTTIENNLSTKTPNKNTSTTKSTNKTSKSPPTNQIQGKSNDQSSFPSFPDKEKNRKIKDFNNNITNNMIKNTNDNVMQKQLELLEKNVEMLKKENEALNKALSSSSSLYPSNAWQPNMPPYQQQQQQQQQKHQQQLSNQQQLIQQSYQNSFFLLNNFKREILPLKENIKTISIKLEKCNLSRNDFKNYYSTNISEKLSHLHSSLKSFFNKPYNSSPVEKLMIESLKERLKNVEEKLKKTRNETMTELTKAEERLIKENSKYKISESELKKKLLQMEGRMRTMRKRQEGFVDLCQKIKIFSQENGVHDFSELLKSYATEDLKLLEEEIGINKVESEENDNILARLINEKQSLEFVKEELEDENKWIGMENQRLKNGLEELNSSWKEELNKNFQNQNLILEKVILQLEVVTKETDHVCRCGEHVTPLIKTLEDYINIKERMLSSLLAELDQLKLSMSQPLTNEKPPFSTSFTQTRTLEQEIKPVSKQEEKFSSFLEFMKLKSSNQSSSLNKTPPSPQHSPTEFTELKEKNFKLENNNNFLEKKLNLQNEQQEKTKKQLFDLQNDLRLKRELLDLSENNEKDLRRELNKLKSFSNALKNEFIQKNKMLKLKETEKIKKTEKDEDQEEDEKQELLIETLEEVMDENSNLKVNILQLEKELKNEKEITSGITYEKLIMQEEIFKLQKEKEEQAKELEKSKDENLKMNLDNEILNSQLSIKKNNSEEEKKLRENIKKLTNNLNENEEKLKEKENELQLLQDTIKYVMGSDQKNLPSSSSSFSKK